MTMDKMVDAFKEHNKTFVDKFFPEKEILAGPEDKPYFTEELRQIKRRRQRIYAKYGRRHRKYISLKQIFDDKLRPGNMWLNYKRKSRKENRALATTLWKKQEVSILSYTE